MYHSLTIFSHRKLSMFYEKCHNIKGTVTLWLYVSIVGLRTVNGCLVYWLLHLLTQDNFARNDLLVLWQGVSNSPRIYPTHYEGICSEYHINLHNHYITSWLKQTDAYAVLKDNIIKCYATYSKANMSSYNGTRGCFKKDYGANNPNLSKIQVALMRHIMVRSCRSFAHVTTAQFQKCDQTGSLEGNIEQIEFLHYFSYKIINLLYNRYLDHE